MSLMATTARMGARALLRSTPRTATLSARALAASKVQASAVGPMAPEQSSMYHDIIIEHYENPRNVGT